MCVCVCVYMSVLQLTKLSIYSMEMMSLEY